MGVSDATASSAKLCVRGHIKVCSDGLLLMHAQTKTGGKTGGISAPPQDVAAWQETFTQ